MADVEQRAEAEASAKGLSGQARKSYIGGVFNKIRQAHARVVKPGKGKTFMSNLNRRNRQLARARYQEALRPHEEAVTALKQQRKHELAQLSPEKQAKPGVQPFKQSSDPITRLREHEEGLKASLSRGRADQAAGRDTVAARNIGAYERELELTRQQLNRTKDHAIGGRIVRQPPKREPAERQRQRAIADAIKHGAPDFPPGTLAAAQGKPAQPATKGKKAEADAAYGARQDARVGLRAGTHEKLMRHGFYVLEPQVSGGPWTIYREDGKIFRGVNQAGSAGGENGGIRAVESRAEVEAFADLVAQDPGKITPRTDKAQNAMLIAHARGEMPALPQPAQPATKVTKESKRNAKEEAWNQKFRDAYEIPPDEPEAPLAERMKKPVKKMTDRELFRQRGELLASPFGSSYHAGRYKRVTAELEKRRQAFIAE